MTKATLYLEDPIHKALHLKAAETRQSMSELVNDALKASLLEDLDCRPSTFWPKLSEKLG